MGFLRFETPRARYTLELETHELHKNPELKPEEYDALFLENAAKRNYTEREMEEILNRQAHLFESKRRKLIEAAQQTGTELWFGDFDVKDTPGFHLKTLMSWPALAAMWLWSLPNWKEASKKRDALEAEKRAQKSLDGLGSQITQLEAALANNPKSRKLEKQLRSANERHAAETAKLGEPVMTRRELITQIGKGSAKIMGGAAAYSVLPPFPAATDALSMQGNLGHIEWVRKLVSWFNKDFFPQPSTELRNAVAARKLEETVAAMLAKESGKKPRIGLVYGAKHAALKEHLESPDERNGMIERFRPDFNGLVHDQTTMRSLYRCVYDKAAGKWKVKKSEIKI